MAFAPWRQIVPVLALLLGFAAAAAAQRYTVRDLGALHAGWHSLGTGINTAGQVAGVSEGPGFEEYRAFRYSQGSLVDLGSLGGTLNEGLAINDLGDVVGDATTTSDRLSYHAFLWHDGVMADLGTLPFRAFLLARTIDQTPSTARPIRR
jgi:probable HAF family extracellular repeat protein